MKLKFNANTKESFLNELSESGEEKFKENLKRYVDEYYEYLLGLYEGDVYERGEEDVEYTVLMTESPIERLFYIAFKKVALEFGFVVGDGFFDITPQEEIKVRPNKKYRVDFSIRYFDGIDKVYKIFIELNGHDYHHSSKDKVTSDRQRERILQNVSDRVMTFTGTEVFIDADSCATEVMLVLRKMIQEGGRFDR